MRSLSALTLIFVFFLCLGSTTARAQQLSRIVEELGRDLRGTPTLASCRSSLESIYSRLPRSSFEGIDSAEITRLPEVLSELYFQFGELRYHWHERGELLETDLPLLATADRVILHALTEALFLREVVWPMHQQKALASYKGYPKTTSRMVGFVNSPFKQKISWDAQVPWNLQSVLTMPIFVSVRGGPNSFFSPFIARQPLDGLSDSVVSHSLLVSTVPENISELLPSMNPVYQRLFAKRMPGDSLVFEALVEDGALPRIDPAHADFIFRMKKSLALAVGVLPRDFEDVQTGAEKLIQEALLAEAAKAYNSSMSPDAEDALYCSQICLLARQLGKEMRRGIENFRAFAMTRLDFGSDEAHRNLGIQRGQEIYSPRDVLIDPLNKPVFILIDPIRAHEAQLADEIRDVLNEMQAQGYRANERTWRTQGMRGLAFLRRQMRDFPPYRFIPFVDRFQQSVPRLTDQQAIFFGANQGPHKVLLEQLRELEINYMRESSQRSELPMPFTKEQRREAIQNMILEPSDALKRVLLSPEED